MHVCSGIRIPQFQQASGRRHQALISNAKHKYVPIYDVKSHTESRHIAPAILKIGTGLTSVVKFTIRPLYHHEEITRLGIF
jgi:hypothetical protein